MNGLAPVDRIYSEQEEQRLDQQTELDASVSAVVEKYADMLRRICTLYLKNPADVEDVMQEVFLQFFLNADSLSGESHQKAWLCRVAFNRCKDMVKNFWRKNVVSIEEMEIPCQTPQEGEVMQAVLALPLLDRQLIYLHYYEGYSVPEIAPLLEKNINTVYSRLRRARMRLKKKVGDIL
jgi:RNA polymerase sigma-70 factor (ECF subfamily)